MPEDSGSWVTMAGQSSRVRPRTVIWGREMMAAVSVPEAVEMLMVRPVNLRPKWATMAGVTTTKLEPVSRVMVVESSRSPWVRVTGRSMVGEVGSKGNLGGPKMRRWSESKYFIGFSSGHPLKDSPCS